MSTLFPAWLFGKFDEHATLQLYELTMDTAMLNGVLKSLCRSGRETLWLCWNLSSTMYVFHGRTRWRSCSFCRASCFLLSRLHMLKCCSYTKSLSSIKYPALTYDFGVLSTNQDYQSDRDLTVDWRVSSNFIWLCLLESLSGLFVVQTYQHKAIRVDLPQQLLLNGQPTLVQ
jgi:hypothetical protein